MITAQNLRTQYAKNAAQLTEMVEAAKVVTNEGAGGAKGKRYRGFFYHQLVARRDDAIANSTKSDAELATVLRLLGNL